eukprot:1775406-Rhodomonas_salina.2
MGFWPPWVATGSETDPHVTKMFEKFSACLIVLYQLSAAAVLLCDSVNTRGTGTRTPATVVPVLALSSKEGPVVPRAHRALAKGLGSHPTGSTGHTALACANAIQNWFQVFEFPKFEPYELSSYRFTRTNSVRVMLVCTSGPRCATVRSWFTDSCFVLGLKDSHTPWVTAASVAAWLSVVCSLMIVGVRAAGERSRPSQHKVGTSCYACSTAVHARLQSPGQLMRTHCTPAMAQF